VTRKLLLGGGLSGGHGIAWDGPFSKELRRVVQVRSAAETLQERAMLCQALSLRGFSVTRLLKIM
jgi:hypothetical protein